MNKYRIELIEKFYTLFHTLPDGKVMAAIILPSYMDYRFSAACVRVMADGTLVQPKNTAKFIKPATFYEITDEEFRKACRKNGTYIKKKFADFKVDTVADDIIQWIITVSHKCNLIRIFYGGDAYSSTFMNINPGTYSAAVCINILHSLLYRIEYRDWADMYNTDTQIIIHTCNAAKLDDTLLWANKTHREIPDYIHTMCDAQSYADLSLYCPTRITYHWEQEGIEDAIDDLDIVPGITSPSAFFNNSIAVKIPAEAYDIFHRSTC